MVVPETNHLNLALHIVNGDEVKTVNEDRDPVSIRQTRRGQVEWTQITPKTKRLNLYIENKSPYAGNYRLAVRTLVDKTRIQPVAWDYFEEEALQKELDSILRSFPLINDERGVTFEIIPKRNITKYALEVTAIEPDVNFALVVRVG